MSIFSLSNLFPFETTSVEINGDLKDDLHLSSEEKSFAKSFSQKRFREFSSGRYCAKKALEKIGCPVLNIPKAANGAPIWPKNIKGSITHANWYVGAVVCGLHDIDSIGVDVEDLEKFPAEIQNMVIRSDEKLEFSNLKNDSELVKSAIFFSAKESVYKAFNVVHHFFLEFHDVKIRFDGEHSFFLAEVLIANQAQLIQKQFPLIRGRVFMDSHRVYTCAWINSEK